MYFFHPYHCFLISINLAYHIFDYKGYIFQNKIQITVLFMCKGTAEMLIIPTLHLPTEVAMCLKLGAKTGSY
jgi:hypothetical protein